MFIGGGLRAAKGPTDDFWYQPISGVLTAAGERVSADASMQLTVVYRCVSLLSATLAKLPVKLRRRDTKEDVTAHPVSRLLTKRPNRWQTPFQFRQMQAAHVLLRGNAYARQYFDRGGNVVELVPMHPDRVTIELLSAGDWRYVYRAQNEQPITLLREEVLHLKGLSVDVVCGIGPISAQREAVGAAISAQKYAARVFKNNARPGGGFISMPGKFADSEARREFRAAYHDSQTGENAHKTPIFENGMTYNELGMTNQDAQFIETRKYGDTDLCRIFGVPPHKVGVLDRATYSNMEQQNVEFFEEIHSWAANFEQLLQMQLLTEAEEDALYVQFEMKGVLRADSATRAKFYHDAVMDGWMTRNEVREREDMEPLDGLDEPLEPLNMAPAGSRTTPDAMPAGDHGDPMQDGSQARQKAILRGAAERAVTREIGAVRKIVERFGTSPLAVTEVEAFYARHAAWLADALKCDAVLAAQWCARRLDVLKRSDTLGALELMEVEGADALWELMQ